MFSCIKILTSIPTQGKVYVFDKVLKPNVTQTQVYDATAKSIVKGRSSNAMLIEFIFPRCALWIQRNNLCVWANIKWKNPHHGGNYWRPKHAGHHTQVFNIVEIHLISSSSFAGLSTTSSIISIQWKRTLSSTSRCPTLRSTWTNAEISLTVSRDQFAAQRNNLDFCSFQGQPGRPWRQGSPSLC